MEVEKSGAQMASALKDQGNAAFKGAQSPRLGALELAGRRWGVPAAAPPPAAARLTARLPPPPCPPLPCRRQALCHGAAAVQQGD